MKILILFFFSFSIFSNDYLNDLSYLKKLLRTNFSYYHFTKKAINEEITLLHKKIKKDSTYSKEKFKIDLQKIIAQSIDGHAKVRKWNKEKNKKELYTPFLTRAIITKNKIFVVAFKSNRESFWIPSHPYITHINKVSVHKLIKKMKTYLPKGTHEYLTHNSVYLIRGIKSFLRIYNEEPYPKSYIDVSFSNDKGSIIHKRVSLIADRPQYKDWPRANNHIDSDNIAYLRISSMHESSKKIEFIHDFFKKIKKTKGLIIDLRGNPGGRRKLIHEIIPYLTKEDRMMASIGICRLFLGCEIGSRYMYIKQSKQYSDRDRSFIKNFMKNFAPSVSFNHKLFSDWHYFLVRKKNYHYTYKQPIIVLIDGLVFSAADIFAGALKSLKNVTLIGASTSGGSAANMSYRLPNSQIKFLLGRMVSFQPNGDLYDTVGISPDIIVSPSPSFFIGKSDLALKKAKNLIK